MLPLRKEIEDYSRSCEHLISAAQSLDAPFSRDEIEWIAYYACEITNLLNKLSRTSRPQTDQKRQTIREYTQACEALLRIENLSQEERESIRRSVAHITTKILDAPTDR